MGRKKDKGKKGKETNWFPTSGPTISLKTETKRSILGILSLVLAGLFIAAPFGAGGVVGGTLYVWFRAFFGFGYYLLPVATLFLAAGLLRPPVQEGEDRSIGLGRMIGAGLLFLSGTALLGVISESAGGIAGMYIAQPFTLLFGSSVGTVALAAFAIIGALLSLDTPLRMPRFQFLKSASSPAAADTEVEPMMASPEDEPAAPILAAFMQPKRIEKKPEPIIEEAPAAVGFQLRDIAYNPPPLTLLEREKGKPETGDIKANANIIKRTLQNFGIVVEMDEVSIGPSVTRFALKPAEGVKLQKIVSLQSNLELALAASPVRIEAPIPGKSLVGIEVPNQKKATVGLASLISESKFVDEKRPLVAALGRDIAGAAHFINIAKMPHLLVAGATGSGKSATIHTIISSLLYRNGPGSLRFIMIDPKRVELTLYNPIPHLLTPVITDPKKAILSLKWAAKEMERRYNLLESHSVRDISSYHENIVAKYKEGEGESPDQMPYIIIVIDELADIMQTYPRELEAAIVRLAQMSRAVGIHLILSTQRPSVNVITGLIKANIPARIALQVASQIDSRTILDAPGAENLLGAGDMLFQSADMSKPHRIQSAFTSENEVKEIASYIRKHNEPAFDDIAVTASTNDASPNALFSSAVDDDDDDLYSDAKATVEDAGKASTSLLQRKLRVGYARAARLMDILEERGVIGPQDGARPRDVLSGPRAGQEVADESL
ncbi:MAG: DNA translocase FtsK [Patescibacteria group bacterium]